MPAVALTDAKQVFNWVNFYKEAIANHVKPILGVDLPILWESFNVCDQVVILCKDNTGVKNLMRLISMMYEKPFFKDRILLPSSYIKQEDTSGLILLVGVEQGSWYKSICEQDEEVLNQWQSWLTDYFPNRWFMAIQRLSRSDENIYLKNSFAYSTVFKAPLVATCATRFLDAEDFDIHEARICIEQGYLLNDDKRPKRYHKSQYFQSQEEMSELFSDLPEALFNTLEIAKSCNITLDLNAVHLPIFPLDEGQDIKSYFYDQAKSGLDNRLLEQRLQIVKHMMKDWTLRQQLLIGWDLLATF